MSQAQASGEYERIVEQAAGSQEIHENWKSAVPEALMAARRVVDGMHPDTRAVHDFNRAEIREIEQDVREKINTAEYDGSWKEINLTEREVRAIHSGLVEMRTNENYQFESRHRAIAALL